MEGRLKGIYIGMLPCEILMLTVAKLMRVFPLDPSWGVFGIYVTIIRVAKELRMRFYYSCAIPPTEAQKKFRLSITY